MNKYILILACSLLAIPGFTQQVNVNVSTSQSLNLPVATDTQPGLLSAPDHVKFGGMENPLNKNKPGGYAGLDDAGMLPWKQIGNVPTASATTPGCLTAQDWLTFNLKQPRLGFTPENIANKNVANGYMGADAKGLLPWTKLSGIPQANASAKGVLSAQDWTAFNLKQNALGYSPENPVNKDQPKGYPGLDPNGKILASELPAGPIQVWNEVYQVPAVPVPTYTLLNPNAISASVVAHGNKLRLTLNSDYTVNGNVVTFSPMPNAGDVFVFDYQRQ